MNDPAAILERSLRHDAWIRAAGNDPGPVAESHIIDFIAKYKLYETETARQWLIDRSSTQNEWVARGVIKSIGPLTECGHPDEAVAIFTSVVGLEDEKVGPRRRRELFHSHSLSGHQLKTLLRTSGLVGTHPGVWGTCLVRLQTLLLLEEQQEQIERWGETSESPKAIVAHYDDYFHYRYYQRERSDRDAWGTAAQAIEQGLAETVALSEKGSFCIL